MHHQEENNINSISDRLQSDSEQAGNLFTAIKQLVDTEIKLIEAIENHQSKEQVNTMSAAVKKQGKKSSTVKPMARPSAALLAAKREAANRAQKEKPKDIFVHDIYRKAADAYKSVRKPTGLVFDRSMTEHQCLWDPNYAECPARFSRVLQRCEELDLVNRCTLIPSRSCTESDILIKHTQKQLDTLKGTSGSTDAKKLEKLSSKYDSIYIHPSTYKLSLLAVGCTINLVEYICKGQVQNGMAIIRPPGHHAMKSEYCGYCFFNNVAIATEKALKDKLANRILIVDWDVHHGQATQQMFYNDPRVVYFSIHRYEYGQFWPNLKESDYHYIGEGPGEGYNFNVPLNKIGMTNADYIAIFQQVLLPMAYEFQPDLVIVSAGYDAALGCPEGEMEVTPACYAHLLSSLLGLANGRVAVVLEGGYCLKSLAEGAALTLRALLGDPCPMLQPLDLPSTSIRDTILNAIYAHRKYWKCFQYHELYDAKEQTDNRHVPTVIYKGEVLKTNVYETRDCYPVQTKEVFQELDKKLDLLISSTNLSKAPNKVCIIYDDRMLRHCDPTDDTHPEKPTRIQSIYKRHEENDLLRRCHMLKGREVTQEELLLVHSKDYVEKIKRTEHMKLHDLETQSGEYNSIYFHNETWLSAQISAGSVLQVVDSVLNGESQSGVCIVRPPGHHANEDVACGFCIFNNVALAARYAIECHTLNRVLIVDWDVHHGNGTQSIFEEDPKVLYISVHRYDEGAFFPGSAQANYTAVGTGAGAGFSVNIPWNKRGMGDVEYIAAFQRVVMPIAYQFNPELVLVSAGFDACIGDPLGGCLVSPEMYGHLTHWLSSLANGRIILALEGGYNVNSISDAMCACTKALLGDPLPMLDVDRPPCTTAIDSINNVVKVQKAYWSNLMFDLALPRAGSPNPKAGNPSPKTGNPNPKTGNPNPKVGNPNSRTQLDSNIIENIENHGESKIALEGIESEKLELNLSIDKSRLNSVTDEEITKLQNEIENIKIKNSKVDDTQKEVTNNTSTIKNECAKQCINPNDQARGGKRISEENRPGTSSDRGFIDNGEHAGRGAPTTLSEYITDNLQALMSEEMFAVVPLRECPHLDTVEPVPESGIDVHLPCTECESTAENWICLRCYTVHCARNINAHGLEHAEQREHPMTLSFSDLSVWCYGCEAYIDNPRLYAARNAAHQSKFNEELPWTYDNSLPNSSQR